MKSDYKVNYETFLILTKKAEELMAPYVHEIMNSDEVDDWIKDLLEFDGQEYIVQPIDIRYFEDGITLFLQFNSETVTQEGSFSQKYE